MSAAGALAAVDLAADRGWEAPFASSFGRRLITWGLWALLTWVLVPALLAAWRRPWPVALLCCGLLLPGAVWLHDSASEPLLTGAGLDRRSLMRELRRLDDEDGGAERGAPFGREGPPGDEPPFNARGPGGRRGPEGRRGEGPPPGARDGGHPPDGRPADQPPEFRGDRRSGGRPPSERPLGPLSSLLDFALMLGTGLGARVWLSAQDEQRRANALQLQAARLQSELSGARLDRLTAQLKPHFLFNTLHAVGGLVREDRKQDALATLSAVSDLLRGSLDPRGRHTVSLDEELASVAGYLAIASIRLGDRLVTRIEVDEGCGVCAVPVLSLLPLVENVIVHVAEPRVEPTTLTLRASLQGEQLEVVLEDDGPGFSAEVLASGTAEGDDRPHVGLSNTAGRLRTLYGDRAAFRLANGAEGGARVVLSLPRRLAGDVGDGAVDAARDHVDGGDDE